MLDVEQEHKAKTDGKHNVDVQEVDIHHSRHGPGSPERPLESKVNKKYVKQCCNYTGDKTANIRFSTGPQSWD